MVAGARGKGRPTLVETPGIDRAIRDAALQILLAQGEAATMNAVAVAAGVSRKSLYARYPNKKELFLEAIGELLQGARSLEYETGGSAEDRLFQYIQAASQMISSPQSRAIQRLLTTNPGYIAALRAEMLAATQTRFLDPLHALLEEAKRTGELVIDNVEETARLIARLILAEAVASDRDGRARQSSATKREYAAFLAKLLIRGLAPRP